MNRKRTSLSARPRLALWSSSLLLALAVSASRPAAAQDTGMDIYRGDSKAASGLTLGSWGSGTAEDDTNLAYSGTDSLRLVTHGLYQGARLVMAKPVDFTPYVNNKNAYLQFAVRLPNANGAGGGRGGFPGGPGGFAGGPGGPSGAGGAGMSSAAAGYMGNYGRGGGAGGRGGGESNVKVQKAKSLENLRILMVTGTDKLVEFTLPLSYAKDDNQWKLLGIPVPAIAGLKGDDAQVKEIRVFGDTPTILNVGAIRVVVDATPLVLEPISEKIFQRNDIVRLTANASGGFAPLKYSWDFDASDGIQEEGEGRSIKHTFRKTGDYTVTVTVGDAYNMKPPVKTTFHVHVTP